MSARDFSKFSVTAISEDAMEIRHPLDKQTTIASKPANKSKLTEKCVFVCSSVCMIVLGVAILHVQWLLPYMYSVLTPVLLVIRVVMYWRNGWQYFLLDFCYFANIVWSIFLWSTPQIDGSGAHTAWVCPPGVLDHTNLLCAVALGYIPDEPYLFATVFSLANGPLLWAMIIYRNSLVYHNIDKVTSTYIHILPPLLSYVIRWYPERTSLHWFREFMPTFLPLSPIWMYFVPFAAFVFHSGLYSLVVNWIAVPTNGQVSSYNYLGEKDGDFTYKLFNCCGSGCRCGMFYFWNWVYCLVALFGAPLAYSYYWFHCALVAFLCLMGIWNGGSYYVDVFSVKGFVDDIE